MSGTTAVPYNQNYGLETSPIEPNSRHARVRTKEELERVFSMPAEQACSELGIRISKLKRLCRQYGISRWPYRRVKRKERSPTGLYSFQSAERALPPPPTAAFPIPGMPGATSGQSPLQRDVLSGFAMEGPLNSAETSSGGNSAPSTGLSTPVAPSDLTLPKLRVPKPDIPMHVRLSNQMTDTTREQKAYSPEEVVDILRRAQARVHGPAAQTFLAQQVAGAAKEVTAPAAAAAGQEGNFTSPFLTVQQPTISLKHRMANILRFALSYRVQAAWQQQHLQASLSSMSATPAFQSEIFEALEEHKKSTYEDIAALEKAGMELYANLSQKDKAEFPGKNPLSLQPAASSPGASNSRPPPAVYLSGNG